MAMALCNASRSRCMAGRSSAAQSAGRRSLEIYCRVTCSKSKSFDGEGRTLPTEALTRPVRRLNSLPLSRLQTKTPAARRNSSSQGLAPCLRRDAEAIGELVLASACLLAMQKKSAPAWINGELSLPLFAGARQWRSRQQRQSRCKSHRTAVSSPLSTEH